MAKILVVDDSMVDRQLAGGLLEKQPGWSVCYAENGQTALGQLESERPDLVVTDLQMPELNGLELVEAVRAAHPLVPVVLMTARGSEEIAVQALEKGAASYVPKKSLARDLTETVDRILAASQEHKSYRRLLSRLNGHSFVLENDLDLISSLVSYLIRTVREMGLFDETDCQRLMSALDEALTNAYYHGNLEVSSELRERDHRAYQALATQRTAELPYRERRIYVTSRFSPTEVRFVIRDDGQGFDPARLADPTDPEFLERLSGRGVFLMHAFMDEVSFNETGNEVTLLKRRSPGGEEAGLT